MRIIGKLFIFIQIVSLCIFLLNLYIKHKDSIQNNDYIITPEKVSVSFDDICGLDHQKEWIEKVLNSNEKPNGLLLYGPPGTGKTMLAKAIASKMNGNFINASASLLQNKFYGETPKIIQNLFKLASQKKPCVIFFDELDGLLSKRDFLQEPADRVLKTTLLSCMDGILNFDGIFLVGATNRKTDIDDAILRRFRMQLEISYPDDHVITNQLICYEHDKILPLIKDKSLSLSDISQLNKLVKISKPDTDNISQDDYIDCINLFF